MRSSCIKHTKNERLVLIRESYINICNKNIVAAALLSFFEYWHNIKLDMREKNREANRVAQMHGEECRQDETLYQFHNMKELTEGIMSLGGETKIRDSIRSLTSLGFVSVHKNPNPRYNFDKTNYFLFNSAAVNEALEKLASYELESASTDTLNIRDRDVENTLRSRIYTPPSVKNTGAITEITTETTTENKTITSANAEIDENKCTCTTFGKCKVCRPTTDEVKQVFDYWVVRTGRAKPVLGEKRRAKIVRALKNYSVEKLKTAIDGCMKSPYHQGDNETGTKYDDLELILRNETKIEFFIAKAQQAGLPPDSIYKPNPIFNGAINYNQSRRQS